MPSLRLRSSKASVKSSSASLKPSPDTVPYVIRQGTPEYKRLDAMHQGYRNFMGGRLTLAPLEGFKPEYILEVGSGAGAWAIQAAEQFPDANVTAVDINPLPPRPLPDNLKFMKADLRQPLAFLPESFDIIHIRFVLIYIPNFDVLLRQLIRILAPGGWLLLEDIDTDAYDPATVSPAIHKFYEIFHRHAASRGTNPRAPRQFAEILRDSRAFAEVNIKEFSLPCSGKCKDPKLAELGGVMNTSLHRAYNSLNDEIKAAGLTEDIARKFLHDLNNPDSEFFLQVYLTWSQKKEKNLKSNSTLKKFMLQSPPKIPNWRKYVGV